MSLIDRVVNSAQAARFVRLFLAALAPQLVAVGGNYTRDVVVAAIVGAAEVAFRAVFPPSPVTVVTEPPKPAVTVTPPG